MRETSRVIVWFLLLFTAYCTVMAALALLGPWWWER